MEIFDIKAMLEGFYKLEEIETSRQKREAKLKEHTTNLEKL
jgi:hypothetical protein